MAWRDVKRTRVKLYKPYYRITKRILELAVCIVAIPFVIPIAALVMLAIRFDSKGPVFFVQNRVGKDGRLFKLFKFRTMHDKIDRAAHAAYMRTFIHGQMSGNNSNSSSDAIKPFASKEVTRVGRILRKTSLDELPQLINVFKGEMSLVGPRPNIPGEVEAYQAWHKERFEVLPGITGLAQVRGRSGIPFDKIVEYDIEYIKKQSLLLDLQILWWTVSSVIKGKGAK